jgi:uncharacterized membrane protein YebE (DUF533 family)
LKIIDAIPTIIILGLIAFLGWLGYSAYNAYQENANDPNAPGPGGSTGAQKPASFGSFVDDSLFSIGQSSQSLSNAQVETFTHPLGTLQSIFGIGDNGN